MAQFFDNYGLPLSTSVEEAASFYRKAMTSLFSDKGDEERLLERSLKSDPHFCLPYMVLARINHLNSKPAQALKLAKQALRLAGAASSREQHHIHVLNYLIEGRNKEALSAMEDHLKTYPRDAYILIQLSNFLFFSGGAGKKKKIAKLFDELAPHYPDDWNFMARHAFHLQEIGETENALKMVERSLALHPQNAYAIHAKIHTLQENQEHEKVLDLLQKWMPTHSARSSFHSHLKWHESLAHLALCRPQFADRIYRSAIRPKRNMGPANLKLADAAGYLWKRKLMFGYLNSEKGDFKDVSTLVARLKKTPPGAFVLTHAALFLAFQKKFKDLDILKKSLPKILKAKSNELLSPLQNLVEGIKYFSMKDYSQAVRCLSSFPDLNYEWIGGSNIERKLIRSILAEACLMDGQFEQARKLLSSDDLKNKTVYDFLFLARAERGLGHDQEASKYIEEAGTKVSSAKVFNKLLKAYNLHNLS